MLSTFLNLEVVQSSNARLVILGLVRTATSVI